MGEREQHPAGNLNLFLSTSLTVKGWDGKGKYEPVSDSLYLMLC